LNKDDKIPKGTHSKSYPVHITGDIIWAFLPLPPGQASSYPDLPESIEPLTLSPSFFTVRDLPYSFDFALENRSER
jgi:hypothetical protein